MGKNDWFDYWSGRKKKIIIIKLKKLKQKNTGSIIVPAPFATALLVAYERKAHGDRNMSFLTFYTCFDLGLIVSHYYTTIG